MAPNVRSVDLTALIFVALAVAWAVYLIPKALRAHDDLSRSRSVDRFSSTMRVLARREPVAGRSVVTPSRAESVPVVTTKQRRPSAAAIKARREAARQAAQRRRRVLGTILALNLFTAIFAVFGVISFVWQAIPLVLLAAWLVACRLMVKQEQAAWAPVRVRMPRSIAAEESAEEKAEEQVSGDVPAEIATARNDQGFDEVAPEAETSTISAVDAELWDPVPVTLPTYVGKPAAARRTSRSIDLGAPGTWTSGRTEEDAALAQQADADRRAARNAPTEQRKTGS